MLSSERLEDAITALERIADALEQMILINKQSLELLERQENRIVHEGS